MPKAPKDETEKRIMARLRRERVRQRNPDPGVGDGEIRSIYIDPVPLFAPPNDSGVFEASLVPIVDRRDWPGRRERNALLERLRQALAVQTLIAYESLEVILKSKKAALCAIDEVGLPLGAKRLMSEGRKRVATWTMLNSMRELRLYSQNKYEMLRRLGLHLPLNSAPERTKAELSAVRLLAHAYLRCQKVAAATTLIQRELSKGAATTDDSARVQFLSRVQHEGLEAAFASVTPLSAIYLWELAIYADINPMVLWPQHKQRYGDAFEIARFIGCVDRGVEAVLRTRHFSLVRAILDRCERPEKNAAGDEMRERDEDDEITYAAREKLLQHFRIDVLRAALDAAAARGAALVSTRGSRILRIGEPDPPASSRSRRLFKTMLVWIARFLPKAMRPASLH